MSESFMAVPVHFTVEFLAFLVAGGGAVIVMLRPSLVPGPRSKRIVAAAGLALIAGAQVAHGGSFVEADADTLLAGVRAVGLLLLVWGVVTGDARIAPVTTATVAFEEPVLVAPASAALLLAAVSFQKSFRGGSRTIRRLSLAGLLLAGSEGLTALAPSAALDEGIVDGYAYAAHGVKTLAYLAMATWLWVGIRSSIRSRYVASFAALLVAVILVLSSALTGVISNNVEEAELDRVRSQASNAAADIQGTDARDLAQDAQTIAVLPAVQQDLGRRRALRRLAVGLARSSVFDLDFAVLMTPSGRVVGYAGSGPVVDDRRGRPVPTGFTQGHVLRVQGSGVIQEAQGRVDVAVSLVKVRDTLAIVAASKVVSPVTARPAGLVAIGEFVDATTVEEIAARVRPTRASVIVGGRIVGSTLPRFGGRAIVPDSERASLRRGRTVAAQQTFRNASYLSAFVPLKDGSGQNLDGALILSSPSRIAGETREGVTRILFIAAFGVGVVALALAWFSGLRITRPIQALTATASAVRGGDFEARAQVKSDDEVGRLGAAFNDMTGALLRMTGDLRVAANEEQRLRARIETIVDSMADGLVAIDAGKRILAFNAEAERLTGVTASDAAGKFVSDVLDIRNAQGEELRLPLFDLRDGPPAEVLIQNKEHDMVPVAVTTALLHSEDGGVTGAVAVLRDITRDHEVERMKSEFLSNVSHELRTPLTPIKGYAEILGRQDVPPEKAAQFVGGILESTARLERIIELLVDFSALEAGRLTPRNRPVDMKEMITGLAGEWSRRATRHDVVAEVDGELPNVVGDERLIRRSLEEILDNAVKFSPRGGKIRLRLEPSTTANNGSHSETVRVTVADQGIGISAEDLPKIFSDFRQLDGSSTRAYGGLGLGLAFVQRIMEAHDGSIEVQSDPEVGTSVAITIPAAAPGRPPGPDG